MTFYNKFCIWLSKNFDIPKWKVGDTVAVLPERSIGIVTHVSKPSYWAYRVKYNEPRIVGNFMREEWLEIDQGLVEPYVEDLLKKI